MATIREAGISVNATIGTAGAAVETFGQAIFITSDTETPYSEVPSYTSLTDVAEDWPTTSEVYRAARVYFGQTWYPSRFYVGRWLEEAAGSKLLGSEHDSLASLQAIRSTPSTLRSGLVTLTAARTARSVTLDGAALTGLSLSGDGDNIASQLQAALRASSTTKFSDATVTWEAAAGAQANTHGYLTISIPRSAGTISGPATGTDANDLALDSGSNPVATAGTSETLIVDGATAGDLNFAGNTQSQIASELQVALRAAGVTKLAQVEIEYDDRRDRFVLSIPAGAGDFSAAATGTAAEALGLDDGTIEASVSAETLADGLTRIRGINAAWHLITAEYAITNDPTNAVTLSNWVGSQRIIAFIGVSGNAVLAANEESSSAALVSARASNRVALWWSSATDYKYMGVAARFAAINYSRPNAVPTAKWLRLTGVTADNITSSQRAELNRKRINHYLDYPRGPITAEGVIVAPGHWIDSNVAVDWLVTEQENELWDLAVDSVKVPATIGGVAQMVNVLDAGMRRAVNNGIIAVGETLSAATIAEIRSATGNAAFDGVLATGYLIYPTPLRERSLADRGARRAIATIWARISGALHAFDIAISVEE